MSSDINSQPNKSTPDDSDNLLIQDAIGQGFRLSIANLLAETRADIAALQAQFNSYIPLSQKGAAGGVASLGNDGKVPTAQLPASSSGSSANSNVLLLLNFQGNNGSQAIVDTSSSPKNIQVFGNAQIQNNAGVFDGSGDYLRIAKSQLDISALTEYTIEVIGKTAATSPQLIFTTYNLTNTANHFFFQWNLIGNDAQVYFSPTVATNTNVHLALVRSGGKFDFYQNGVKVGNSVTAPNFSQGGDFFIGGSPGDPTIGTRWLNAKISGIRISNIARYSSNFTAPTNFL